ncbi:MAG TPA: 50S ribosomal protein L1, partial [Candidatus Omnitrophota bacterium]|nr:50S ribosomal protein L1 [Candidatus Omnitrophota bacterium]
MKHRSKRYRETLKAYDPTKSYLLPEAVKIVKRFAPAKYDETVGLSFQLGINPEQANEAVRGTAALPHGSGKKIRVLCFAKGEAQRSAEQAGADYVGAEDYVKKIEGGWLEFDAVVAHPDLMRDISKLGKVLGPRGLMPTPKTGTVTPDVGKAIKEIKAGRVEFKNDKTGGLHVICGKKSFPEEALVQNATAVIQAVSRAKPSAAKGDYMKRIYLSASQSPGV